MLQTFTVHLDRPSSSVSIMKDYSIAAGAGQSGSEATNPRATADRGLTQELEAEKAAYLQTCQTLNGVIEKLNQFCDTAFVAHKEEVAKLAVEIARKVLMRKVEDGDYEIESIVKEAIENAPSRDGLVVKLNPQDLSALQKAQQDNNGEILAGIKLVSDANISRAECIVESPKGVIESLIDGHLEQIGKALNEAE